MATAQLRYSSADRREQILDVASGLFAEQGYRGTTTRLIAERAAVTEALIFRHFPSKEELYWSVLERKLNSGGARERMQEILDAGGNDQYVLSRLAYEVLERRARDQTLSRLLLFSALEKHELSERFVRHYVADYFEVLAQFIRKGIIGGRFRNVDPLLAARAFIGMVVYHSWMQEIYGGKEVQDFDNEVVSQTLAAIWLQGMQPVTRAAQKKRPRRKHVKDKG